MATDLTALSGLTGMNIYLLAVITIWSLCWKIAAMWKAAKKGNKGKGSLPWFIVLAIVNTVGILEILYIFVFSEIKLEESRKKVVKKKKRR